MERPPKNEEALVQELKDILIQRSEAKDALEYHDKTLSFTKQLEEELSKEELLGIRLYHVLIGSTPDPDRPTDSFDLPDGRIEKFIREEL